MKESKTYYNLIANNYKKQSNERIKYLNAIDDLIISDLKNSKINNYLDIGAGDGRRSFYIANAIKAKNLTLLDESTEMLKNISVKNNTKIVTDSFSKYKPQQTFDLITCLWNVIGHFESEELRFKFFEKISKLLNASGALYLDVNNRYNILNYGSDNVMRSLSKDFMNDKSSGWFDIRSGNAKTKVYIHSPFDINKYIEPTDLIIELVQYVNYDSGKIESSFFEGQLFYKIIKDV